MNKLKATNILPMLFAWICSILTSQQEKVQIGNVTSSWLDVGGNDPQGTLQGILLFLITINDLRLELPMYNFVDDTTVYKVGSDKAFSVQTPVDSICSWSEENKIDSSKTKEIIVNFWQSIDSEPLSVETTEMKCDFSIVLRLIISILHGPAT